MRPLHIAALVYGPDSDPATALVEVARVLRARGVALAGAVQHDTGPCNMELELLPSALRMSISQKLGGGAIGCRLDAAALAEAASIVRQAIDAAPSLVIFNKFGAQEVAGEGMSAEIAAAVMAGVPVLTTVGERFLTEWLVFTGGESTQLVCSADAALTWWNSVSDE